MIQFNLLPDVKVEFIKARRAKRTVIAVAFMSVLLSVTVLIIMISITLVQKRHISDLNSKIKSGEKTLQDTPNLAKILTIQNQLNSLPTLYVNRPVTSRLFSYVQATTPTQVGISHLSLDYAANTLKIEGTADSLESVNRYVDTLKFTTYTLKDSKEAKKPFSNVVLATFSRSDVTAAFTINLVFDHTVFDASEEVKLNVPKTTTTRSETELPTSGVFDTKGAN